jgi:hypothetical protein
LDASHLQIGVLSLAVARPKQNNGKARISAKDFRECLNAVPSYYLALPLREDEAHERRELIGETLS